MEDTKKKRTNFFENFKKIDSKEKEGNKWY